jgi:hypothetical protein
VSITDLFLRFLVAPSASCEGARVSEASGSRWSAHGGARTNDLEANAERRRIKVRLSLAAPERLS